MTTTQSVIEEFRNLPNTGMTTEEFITSKLDERVREIVKIAETNKQTVDKKILTDIGINYQNGWNNALERIAATLKSTYGL